MFPISSDGAIEDPLIFFEQDGFLEDLIVDFATLEGKDHHIEKGVKKRPRKVEENNQSLGSSDSKKNAHRFTEKQRRQEMSTLYTSLRSLLPLEYIKGKRAVSDHMGQAVSYIEDTKKKIEEMKLRRERLKKPHNAETSGLEAKNQDSSNLPYSVKINLFKDGFEILMSSGLNKECIPLSMVLADLLRRKLNVIDCTYTKGDQSYLHKIHIELDEPTRIDLSELQEGIVNVLKHA